MKNLENLTDSEKIDYLIKKIDQIDRAVNPPLWKATIKWFINNFWTLLGLAIIGYFLWQVWEAVQYVQSGLTAVELKLETMKSGVSEQFKSLGEALSRVKEFDLDSFKFWD